MFSFKHTISVSKLKSFSNVLGCSFSSLRFSLRSISTKKSITNATKSDIFTFKVLSQNIKALSTDKSVDHFFKEIDIQKITEGNEHVIKILKVLMLEVEVMRQEGHRVPSTLSEDQWKELLSKSSKSQRSKQLTFWWLNEKRKIKDKNKKEEAKKKNEARAIELKIKEDSDIFYGFGGNTIFMRIYDSKIDNLMNQKLIQAMIFGQTLVVDCSYDEHMTPKEAFNCAKQLCIIFAENRLNSSPFNLYFCNANRESKVMTKLLKYIPTLYDETFPLNITEKSYLELFPKDKLVYLTPHCRQTLKNYSHDDIYIIGAMVDKVNNEPLSLAKAKSHGLRMAKLPLDVHLDWGIGTKSLTLNQVQAVLLEMKNTGDWSKALQHVPKRKLKKQDEISDKKNVYHLRKRNILQ